MPKLTGLKNPDFIMWKSRLAMAKKVRKDAGEESWKNNISLFNNNMDNWNKGILVKGEILLINKLRSTVSFIRDSVYFREPKIEVEPEPDGSEIEIVGSEKQVIPVEEVSELVEEIVNKLFRRLKVKRIGKKCILDGLLTPLGWIKVYHETQTISATPDLQQVTTEKHVVARVNPFNILVDNEVDSFDMTRVRWIAEKKSMTKEGVQAAYKDATGKDIPFGKLQNDGYSFDGDESDVEKRLKELSGSEKEELERVIVWEIHDRENDELIELSLSNGILRRVSPHPYAVTRMSELGFIYVPITLSEEDPGSFYPRPYVESLVPLGHAINKLYTYYVYHVGRQAKRVNLSPKGTFDDPNELSDAPDMSHIEYNVGATEGQPPVSVPPVPNIPEDAWRLSETLFGPIYREISRVDETSLGGVTPGTSPTEAQLINQGTGVGMDAKTDSVGDFLGDTAKILIANAQQFTTKPEAIKITGVEGANWKSWTKDDIQGRFGVTVQAFSTAPFSEQGSRQKLESAVNQLYGKPEIDNVELLGALIDELQLPSRIVRRTTKQGPQDPDIEHTMILQGNPLRVDPNEDHVDHIQKHIVMVQWLQEQVRMNPGNPELTQLMQQLSGHIDQHRAALVQVQQPAQTANAQQGAQQPQNPQGGGAQDPNQVLAQFAGGQQ